MAINYADIEIGKLLGEGGFAEVYKGQYHDTTVAVKKWKVQSLPADQMELFRREVECNKVCSHPNVVRFVGVTTDPLSIVTEFVDGPNLYDYIHDPAVKYTWKTLKQMAQEAAAGIAHIHEKKIVHRDLKSLNLLVDRHAHHVKVCDFGLSRLINFTLKMTGGRGTVHWMAPEVIEHADYNDKADVYSYGIILWELCSRETPYSDMDDEYKIAEAVLLRDFRPTIPSYVPPDVARLIRTCWDPKPANRPTMAQVAQYWNRPGIIPAAMLDQPLPDAKS